MQHPRRTTILAVPALLALGACGSDTSPAEPTAGSASTAGGGDPADVSEAPQSDDAPAAGSAAVDERSIELLRIAYDAASKMPHRPHVKTRSRLQGEAIEALLEVEGGAALVPEWADGIDDWRRGVAYGMLATHYAKAGDGDRAREYLAVAEAQEAAATGDDVQGWHRDTIKLHVATTYLAFGDEGRVNAIHATLGEVESGKLSAIRAESVPTGAVDANVERLLEAIPGASSDQVHFALLSIAHFCGIVYDDTERRSELETAIRESWNPVTFGARVEILAVLARQHIAAGESAKAIGLIDELDGYLDGFRMRAEDEVEFVADIAKMRAQAGDIPNGVATADSALVRFESSRDSIADVFRGEALRPLAEAYVALGESATANDVYERAMAEAVVNPNSRPRATDLVRTCASIVRSGHAPSDSLLETLRSTQKDLGAPW
ncbi:MAG: hypothetical protein AAGB93_07140 [Planctomycetota bacterium]